MSTYQVLYTPKFKKQLQKLEPSVSRLLLRWIQTNLCHCVDPRCKGKGLTANWSGYWRYRIGDYRLIVEIKDRELVIIAIAVAHRSDVYK